MGGTQVEAFLTWLADERQVASATHKQALSALLFLYTKVLALNLPWINQIERPRVRRRLPVVLGREEVSAVLGGMAGELGLLARLLYGTGMRINEALQLRVKDMDFAHQAVIVRAGKGGKDRVLMLPQALAQPLREQLASSRKVWAEDVWPQGRPASTVQDLLGHADVATTMIYTHVLKVGGGAVRSPLDTLPVTGAP
jgi:site-specific recombinase XerD